MNKIIFPAASEKNSSLNTYLFSSSIHSVSRKFFINYSLRYRGKKKGGASRWPEKLHPGADKSQRDYTESRGDKLIPSLGSSKDSEPDAPNKR